MYIYVFFKKMFKTAKGFCPDLLYHTISPRFFGEDADTVESKMSLFNIK